MICEDCGGDDCDNVIYLQDPEVIGYQARPCPGRKTGGGGCVCYTIAEQTFSFISPSAA